jgi:hypothetical protein
LKNTLNLLLVIFAFLAIVVPNSFQLITIVIFTLLFSLILFSHGKFIDIQLVISWLVISLIFVGYIFLSPIKSENKLECIFKYIISPIFWITIFCYIRNNYSLDYIIKKLLIIAFISNVSVLIFYTMMSLGYVSFVKYFIIAPNIDQNTGLGFTLHVYGSLIFFAASIIPSLFFIKNGLLRIIYVFSFIIAAVLSGRTALILFLFLGLSTIFLYLKKIKFNPARILVSVFIIIVLGNFIFSKFSSNFDVDIVKFITEKHLGKIKDGGGSERSEQTRQILNQFYKNPVGSGFVSLTIKRNELKTYNYEVLILTTLMRFGFISVLFIILSLFINFGYIIKNKLLIKVQTIDFFVFGFFAIIISSFTNPYLESFCFQWMFFGPVVLLKEKIICTVNESLYKTTV